GIRDFHVTGVQTCALPIFFIPTHRAGKKVLQKEDMLALKNQLKEVKNKLLKQGFHADDIRKMTAPVQQLIENSSFWREQSDGLRSEERRVGKECRSRSSPE